MFHPGRSKRAMMDRFTNFFVNNAKLTNMPFYYFKSSALILKRQKWLSSSAKSYNPYDPYNPYNEFAHFWLQKCGCRWPMAQPLCLIILPSRLAGVSCARARRTRSSRLPGGKMRAHFSPACLAVRASGNVGRPRARSFGLLG